MNIERKLLVNLINLSKQFQIFIPKNIVEIDDTNHPLYHLNKDQLADLLNDYFYQRIKNEAIIEKYEIVIEQPNYLYRFLPKVFSNFWCPYDSSPYQLTLPSKSKFPLLRTTLTCPTCGHIEQAGDTSSNSCTCKYCEKKRAKEKESLEYLELSQEEKIRIFLEKEKTKAKVSFQSISMFDRLSIAAILQQSNTEYGKPIPYFGQYNFSSSIIHPNELLQLYNKGILKIHGSPAEDKFRIKELSVVFEPRAVEFDLNVYDEQCSDEQVLFEKLKFAKDFHITDEDAFREIWQVGVLLVLSKVIDLCIEKESIPILKQSETTKNRLFGLLHECLEDNSPAQVYEIIWPAFRQISENSIEYLANPNLTYLEKNDYKIDLFEKLVDKIQDRIELKRFEKYPIKGFNLNAAITIPKYLSVLFSDVLENENWFFAIIPTVREIENTNKWSHKNFYNSIRKQELFLSQYQIDELINKIEFGYVTPYGLVVKVDHELRLFGTERDLFYLMENIELEQVIDYDYYYPNWKQLSEQTEWYFEDPYTSVTIYNLLSQLTQVKKIEKENVND